MTTMTIAPASTEPSGNTSYNTGYNDGELAAITKLPARRAMARAAMAQDHDFDYAVGYMDGYLHQIQVSYALAQKAQAV